MKLVSYRSARGEAWGALQGDSVIDSSRLGDALAGTLKGFVAQCANQPDLLAQVAAGLSQSPDATR